MVTDKTAVEPGAGGKRGAGQGDEDSAAMFVQVELGAGKKRGAWAARWSPWAFASAIFGLLALFAAHVAGWERGTDHYVPNGQPTMANLEEALAEAEARGEEMVVDRATILTNPYALYRVSSYLWATAAAMGLLLSARLFLLNSPSVARPWKRSVHSLLLFSAPLLSWDALQGFRTSRHVHIWGIAEAKASFEVTADLLYKGLIERGYEVQGDFSIHASEEQAISRGRILFGTQRSPFDRWKIDWSGPRRTMPHVVLTVERTESARTESNRVIVYAGSLEAGSPLHDEWSAWLDSLVEDCGGRKTWGWNSDDERQR